MFLNRSMAQYIAMDGKSLINLEFVFVKNCQVRPLLYQASATLPGLFHIQMFSENGTIWILA